MTTLRWITASLVLCGFALASSEFAKTAAAEDQVAPLPPPWQDVTLVFRGTAGAPQEGLVVAGGLPATRYPFGKLTWLRHPKLKEAQKAGLAESTLALPQRFSVDVVGGRRGDLLLMLSRGWHQFVEGREYVLLLRMRGDSARVVEVFQILDELGLVTSDGRILGTLKDGTPALSSYRPGPTTDRWLRTCKLPRTRDRQVPLGEAGLQAGSAKGHRPQAVRPLSAAEIKVLLKNLSGLQPAPPPVTAQASRPSAESQASAAQALLCDSCSPSKQPTPKDMRGWLASPIEFERGRDIGRDVEGRWANACFQHWNGVACWCARGQRLFRWADRSANDSSYDAAFHQDGRSGIAFANSSTPYGGESSCPGTWYGCAYVWLNAQTGRLIEVDIHIHDTRSTMENFSSTLSHELGHALTMGHGCGYLGVTREFFRVDRSVPGLGKHVIADTVRAGDFHCARRLFSEFNRASHGRPWHIRREVDLATVSAVHPQPGQPCALQFADTEARDFGSTRVRARPGKVFRISNIQVENRGLVPARDATITFFLHPEGKPRPRHIVGRYHFLKPVRTWVAASYQVRMPREIDVKVKYNLSWLVTHGARDAAHRNNVATLRKGLSDNPAVVVFK